MSSTTILGCEVRQTPNFLSLDGIIISTRSRFCVAHTKECTFTPSRMSPNPRLLQNKLSDTSRSAEWWCNLEGWQDDLVNTRLILNFDLDYFFLQIQGEYVRAFSDDFIQKVCEKFLKPNLHSETILTVAWSPECCGGWLQVAEASRKFFSTLEIQFPYSELPLPAAKRRI